MSAIRHGNEPLAPSFRLSVIWPHTETWPARLRPSTDDGALTLAELPGYPVIVNFWASWCVPCKHEAAAFGASAREHGGQVVFVGIKVQDLKSAGRKFLARYDVPYVSVHDNGDQTYSAYGLTGLPETYYLDRSGRILRHDVGEVARSELERGIREVAP